MMPWKLTVYVITSNTLFVTLQFLNHIFRQFLVGGNIGQIRGCLLPAPIEM